MLQAVQSSTKPDGSGAGWLRLEAVRSGYSVADVLHEVSLEVRPGEIVALLGANGAGKSTLAKTVMGAVPVRSGEVTFDGQDLAGLTTSRVCELGIAIVPEGRRVFARRTITDNLRVAAWPRRRESAAVEADIADLLQRFPILGDRHNSLAGSLSGGEAQMLAIAMALVVRPKLIILDEPSLGMAPVLIDDVAAEVAELARAGTSVLLIEQNARMALDVADRGYVLELGRVVVQGPAADLRRNPDVQEAYLRA